VADKGYHCNATMEMMDELEYRSYISEPKRGRRRWADKEPARRGTYANRRRIRGPRGLQLLRRRGERVERTFAHCLETGGMRRVWLRGHENILKRYLIHVSAFNLGLVMRGLLGSGTPRGLAALNQAISALRTAWRGLMVEQRAPSRSRIVIILAAIPSHRFMRPLSFTAFSTGC